MSKVETGSPKVHHVFGKSVKGGKIFIDRADRIKFLKLLNNLLIRFGAVIYVFALMDTHFHLLVRSRCVAIIVEYLIKAYTGYFSQKYHTSGPLFLWPIEPKEKIRIDWQIDCMLYILNNPAEAGMCKSAGEYFWSSYMFHTKRGTSLSRYIKVDTSLFTQNFKSLQQFKQELSTKLDYQKSIARHKYRGGGLYVSDYQASLREPSHIVRELLGNSEHQQVTDPHHTNAFNRAKSTK